MSSLTDEQRRRMEENRRKALEKRAAAAARAGTAGNLTGSNNSNVPVRTQGAITNKPTATVTRPGEIQSNLSKNTQNVSSTHAPYTNFAGPAQNSISSTSSKKMIPAIPQSTFSGMTVTGHCAMVARDRFLVDVGYHQQLIAVFKSISGHQYDASTKRWTFPMSEHNTLMTAVSSLRPMVSIGGLPMFVHKIFRNVPPGPRVIPAIDLSMIDKTLVNALMPFQADGIRFGISRQGRCLIGDDMGLGKSIQALGIAHYYFSEWPLLIVCPTSMRYAWRESIWNWLPTVPAGGVSVIGTGKDSVANAKVLITSYDMLQRRPEDFSHCLVIIMDESHHLKNHKTARTKAAIPMMQRAKRLILLSGTPALSRPIELFTQISAINRHLFPTFNDFGVRYCDGKKNPWGWDFSGSSNMEELQVLLEETIMIRRLKSDVLQQLPSKLRKLMVLDPTLVRTKNKSLKATAAAFKTDNLKGMERRGKLLEYYSETAIAKLDAVTAYIKELIEDGKKFICFAHHKTMMDGICTMLENMQTRYVRIDGTTNAEDRQNAIQIFQAHDNVPVAVLSITAANSGITLTAANLVIFAELYWNPGVLTQAEDRAHRIGQLDSVLVEYLVAGGTADDVLWPMIQEKLNVLNRAGLSKDNFSDANATALIQRNEGPQQTKLDDFFMSQDIKECSEIENDNLLLDQLMEDSFN